MSVGTPIVAICSLTFAFSLGFEFLRTKSKKSRRTSCAIRMLLLLIPNRLQDLKYESLSPIGSLVHSHGVLRLQQPVLRLQPPWRLVLLESRGASVASYPARSVAKISRPKVLAFFTFVVDAVGYEG